MQRVFLFRHGCHLMGKIFKYNYIWPIETIREDLVKITQIIVEICAHLLLWRSLKVAKLRYAYYYSFSIGVDIVLSYRSTMFGNKFLENAWFEMKYRQNLFYSKIIPQFFFVFFVKDGFTRQNKLNSSIRSLILCTRVVPMQNCQSFCPPKTSNPRLKAETERSKVI